MEETNSREARFSGETVSVSYSPECLPTVVPPNLSCHDESIDANQYQETILNNTEKKVEQYGAGVILMDKNTTFAENSSGLNTDNQQAAAMEVPDQSLQQIVPDASLLVEDIVVEEIKDTNQQQRMLVQDSMPSVQQEASSISCPDNNTPDSVESSAPVVNVTAISSEDITPSVYFSFERQKKELEIISNQLQDGTSVILADVQIINDSAASSNSRKTEESPPILPVDLNNQKNDGDAQKKAPESVTSAKPVKNVYVNRGTVDTTAPFESVKEAVSKFGGIIDWKAHKKIILEKHKQLQLELERMQAEIPECKKKSEAAEVTKAKILIELDSTKKIIEELKLNLEKAQTEEAQAKQDSELAELRVKEMEQGIASESSVAAKAQLELAKSRHEAAVAELKSVKAELKSLQGEYVTLVNERDMTTKKAEDAVSALKEIEKTAEELTLELISTKESLESAHAAHLEAEERRIGAALAREQDLIAWKKELKQAEEEVQQLNQQLSLTKDVKSKLETTSRLLSNLKAELAAYMESKLNQESKTNERLSNDGEEMTITNISTQALASTRKELEEVKSSIEKAKNEVVCLRVAASSLKSELERERAFLANLQQREGMASIAVSSLEAELERTKQELEVVRVKEKEAREKMVELPRLLQQAAQEADQAKSAAQMAREELRKTKEEEEQAKTTESTIEIRLHAALKEIEAARASERLALAAIKALEESDQAASIAGDDSPHTVTLSLDEYFNLSKRAHEAEEHAHERVIAAMTQIEMAKQSETKSLERLSEAYRELTQRKEALEVAMEKSEKAKEGKLGAEQELRKWRAEHEQQRRASGAAKGGLNSQRNPLRTFEQPTVLQSSSKVENDYMSYTNSFTSEDSSDNGIKETKKRKKKRSLVPRIVLLFLARRKSQSFE
ncbi:protein WEAK CHLOROPLAST MOVEMENT UNDER BLUE LIGHT 1 isoform X1 [Canna indica]|uniref:Protein WEAK CHLOROPLAST MOVEMENT UNDER BLUE LIGHT 1 isoform X1 n=1 Tax=Canna indica TaxID=4628 RepID=A0AAQ3JX57_9LILI|nr:protein WEAK CHLOROPLAST MOVEMENT UNDER BLUE LIGHT 1 isoform X1 [Canna indica]